MVRAAVGGRTGIVERMLAAVRLDASPGLEPQAQQRCRSNHDGVQGSASPQRKAHFATAVLSGIRGRRHRFVRRRAVAAVELWWTQGTLGVRSVHLESLLGWLAGRRADIIAIASTAIHHCAIHLEYVKVRVTLRHVEIRTN